jgi:hypothetical protein
MAPDSMSEVLEMVDDGQEEHPVVSEQFRIHDDASANWLVRKIVEARTYAKRCNEWCARDEARAQRDEEFLLFRFGEQLIAHARKRIGEQGARRKSLSLPAGVVGFRHEGPKLLVDDETAVIEWAKQHNPELVSTVERLSKSALNQHLEKTGEVPDVGVRIEPARERFYIR